MKFYNTLIGIDWHFISTVYFIDFLLNNKNGSQYLHGTIDIFTGKLRALVPSFNAACVNITGNLILKSLQLDESENDG